MKNKILFFILFSIACTTLRAQMITATDTLYGNEWINYNQKYFKIKVAEDGIFKIDYSDLATEFFAAGVPLNGVTGAQFMLFKNGEEVPLFVSDNGTFDGSDYFLFYGMKNRGEFDAWLYPNNSMQTNPEHSMFTDTSVYFLTYNASTNHKRILEVANDLSSPPPAEPFYYQEDVQVYNTYNSGRTYTAEELLKSTFDYGEGWSRGFTDNQTVVFPTDNVQSGTCQLEARIISAAFSHDLSIDVGGTNVLTESFINWKAKTYNANFPSSNLSASTNINIRGLASVDDKHSPSYIKLRYPRGFNFNNQSYFKFDVSNSTSTKFLNIQNFNAQGVTVYLYDIQNGIRIEGFNNGGTISIVLPPASSNTGNRELILVSNAAVKNPISFKYRNFTNYHNIQGDYIIVTHPSFYDDGQGNNVVQEYADYRFSTGYNPVLVNVEELYDQFAFGISRHPLSIRHFAAFAKRFWLDAQYIFLIGKAGIYNGARTAPQPYFFVPTFGSPPSDAMLVSGQNSLVPYLAVGRLIAETPKEVRDYLNKVKGLEYNQQNLAQTVEDKIWMKNVIHLGGGNPGVESTDIKNFLNNYKNTIENPRYGASVYTLTKTSTDITPTAVSEVIDSLINAGTSLITFFGHTAPNTFELNLDRPENYNNKDKHPLLMSLGCYSGFGFGTGKSIGEEYVLIPEKGSIGFMASTYLADRYSLNNYASRFYSFLGGSLYGKGIGKIMQEVNRNMTITTPTQGDEFAIQQMFYNGDPAVKLNAHPSPDYAISENSVTFPEGTITTERDSFTLRLNVANIGQALDTTFQIFIERTMPDGTVENAVTPFRITAPYYSEYYDIRIPVKGSNALGLNQFYIKIDNQEEIMELPNPGAEVNNELRLSVFVLDEDILPVWPPDFSIEPTPPTLAASTANSLAAPREYLMQIDTTEKFNSPLFQDLKILQSGGVVDWQPTIPWTDSTVYYWRVGVDSISPDEGYKWKNRSFIYLPNSSRGWNQSHYYQFTKDKYRNLNIKSDSRRFEFIDNNQSVDIEFGRPPYVDAERIQVYLNRYAIHKLFLSCSNPNYPDNNGLYVIPFDSTTLEPWASPTQFQSQYGCVPCNFHPNTGYLFKTKNDELSRLKLVSFLQDSIPDKTYVLIYSVNDYDAANWNTSGLGAALAAQGATQINSLTQNPQSLPYAFFYRKNDPSYTPSELLADSISQIMTGSFTVFGNWNSGYVESVKAGPAASWSDMHWRSFRYDNLPTDDFSVDLIGVKNDGIEVPLHQGIVINDTTLNHVNADTFPYLKLQYNSADELNRTSRQLRYWRINYQGLPEAALRPETMLSFHGDTLQQAEDATIRIMAQNISAYNMDSMLVKYAVVGRPDMIYYKRMRPLPAGDTLILNFKLDTRELVNANQLLIEINPDNDQRELYHFNNLALFSFWVQGDKINPLLDVTFDGQHILNGDIVSAKPEISISMRDENQFLLLSDTSLYTVLIDYPDGVRHRVSFDNNSVVFEPATSANDNKASLFIRYDFPMDGTYALLVRGRDVSGNESGALSYRVQFRVINKAMISNVFNYPNPFTTHTRFVFTLTGSEVPDYVKIQILTVSGKMIREITTEELGDLHIGHNLTEFVWDGTDEFGDRLANGVYLYRVITRSNNKDYEKFETGTDDFFKGGYGKMYLMR